MHYTTRTNSYGIDLNSIRPFSANPIYVAEVITHLQVTKQNLSTKDLINLISEDTSLTYWDLYCANIDLSLLTHISNSCGLCRNGDAFDLYALMKNFLSVVQSDAQLYEAYYKNLLILNADLPSKSTLNPKQLVVWRNTSKMTSLDTRQVMSVRKWISSTLVGLTDTQQEGLAKLIDQYLQGDLLDNLDVRFATSAQFDLWRIAYESDKIRSCMHPLSTCEVGQERTYITYCTQHHGLPDNGLTLAILYQDDTPVARAITYTDNDSKYFVSSYGDDRLYKWLKANGYNQAGGYPNGTILWAGEHYMKPFVDGNVTEANYHYDAEANEYYWRLCERDGEYELQNTDAYANEKDECDLCHARHHDDDMYYVESAVDGFNYRVCECCHDDNTWQVYTGRRHTNSVFFHDGMRPDTNSDYVEYDGDYYERDVLDEYDLKEIDGEVHFIDDLWKCALTDEYFTRDGVFTSADEISTTQPVYFPYNCVSREFWYDNVVECACGTLAYDGDAGLFRSPLFGVVFILIDHYYVVVEKNKAGYTVYQYRLHLDVIECHCEDLDDEVKAEQYLTLCREYERIQALMAQELGI